MSAVDIAAVERVLRETPPALRYMDDRWAMAHSRDSAEEWQRMLAYLQGMIDGSPACSVIKEAAQTLYTVAEAHYLDAYHAKEPA